MVIENGYVVLEDGTCLRAICGGGEGMGTGGGATGAGAAQGVGGMSNVDLTFGQGKVYNEKVGRELALLQALIGASAGRSPGVNTGQTPGPAQFRGGWDPSMILKLLSFTGR